MEKQFSMEDIVPLIREVIATGGTFRLYPRGKSMLPTIAEGIDSVLLAEPEGFGVMDAVLYRRANGKYVLHRVVALHGDTMDLCGDNQINIEHGVPISAVIAKVVGIYKGERYVAADDPAMKKQLRRLYAKKPLLRVAAALKKLVREVFRRGRKSI